MKYVCPEEVRTQRGNLKYLDQLRPLAIRNRHRTTKSELLFWNMCLCKNKTGFRFLRQKPLGKFIPDFYCSKLLLIIEIDGGSHIDKNYLDLTRDEYFKNCGIKTVRYTDLQITDALDKVIVNLKMVIDDRKIELENS